jgi:hypothetical protein
MMPSTATKFQYVNSPFFIFPSYSLHVSAPMGHPQVRYTMRHSHLQHRTTHQPKRRDENNNRRRKKDLHCLQLADRLACQKDWRIAHNIIRGYKRLLTLNFNIFTVLYFIYETSFTVNVNVFATFILSLITCIGDHGSKYQYRHTSSCVSTTDPL